MFCADNGAPTRRRTEQKNVRIVVLIVIVFFVITRQIYGEKNKLAIDKMSQKQMQDRG